MSKERQYQIDATNEIVSRLRNGERRILLHMPIGSGKTRVAGMVMSEMRDKKFIFVVNREALVSQSYIEYRNKFRLKCCVVHNTINTDMFGRKLNKKTKGANAIITLIGSKDHIPDDFIPDFIILDEAHKATSPEFQEIVSRYDVPVVGLTATPGRVKNDDGESIVDWYGNNIINPISFREMIKNGWALQPTYLQYSENDHLVKTWKKLTKSSRNKRTIVFTSNTKQSLEYLEAFRKSKVKAEIITSGKEEIGLSNQTNAQRNQIYRDFRAQRVKVLITVMALCEGFDEPLAKYCLLARNISADNVPLFHQICGRVTRVGSDSCYIVDFGENIKNFGPIEDYDWSEFNNGKSDINSIFTKNGNVLTLREFERAEKVFLRCDGCNHVYDMKKYHMCAHCNKPSQIKLKSDATDLKDSFLKMIPKKILGDLIKNYKTDSSAFRFLAETAKKAAQTKKWDAYNRMYANVFDKDGNLIYPWLFEINKNTKMNDEISWKI